MNSKPTLSICVPLRFAGKGQSYRIRNWKVVYSTLMDLLERRDDIEIIVAEHGTVANMPRIRHIKIDHMGPFNRSQALNVAWLAAKADLICHLDADCIMTVAQWDQAIDEAQQYDCYSPARRFITLGHRKTVNRIQNDRWDWSNPVDQPEESGGRCKRKGTCLFGTISFTKRSFLETVNGWDESFEGWGCEDTAQQIVAKKGGFKIGWGEIEFMHLHHPPASRTHIRANKSMRRRQYNNKTYAQIISERKKSRSISRTGGWIGTDAMSQHVHDAGLSNALVDLLQKNNCRIIADLGCGTGSYLAAFERKGIETVGVDANPATPELTQGRCGVADLTQPWKCKSKPDWLISLEVGEHIPANWESQYLDNLCSQGSEHIVLSWAIPGQRGHGHVNCKANEYVIDRMRERGYLSIAKEANELRKKSTKLWFKNTIMVFHRSPLVFGLGSGRCGTHSLAKLLRLPHEKGNPLPWSTDPTRLESKIERCDRQVNQYRGDVAFYYLPYVDVLRSKSACRFICLQRDKEKTIQSFLSHMGKQDHFTGSGRKNPRWDESFPNYKGMTKTDAIGRYYDEYYETARRLASESDFRIFATDDLNCLEKCQEILDFAEFEHTAQPGIRESVSA